MDCPKCREIMLEGVLDGQLVCRCPQCLGMWFPGDGYARLRRAKQAAEIDVGSAELGREYNEADLAPCPACGQPLQKIEEPSQRHLLIDACSAGHGVFFDAGEYRDYRSKTLGDMFKGWWR